MKSIETSAKTMEEAVTQGLEKLGVSLGDVTIDIIDEGSKGLFGLLGGKPARVRLTVKDSTEEANILSSLSLQNDEIDTKAESKSKEKPFKQTLAAKPAKMAELAAPSKSEPVSKAASEAPASVQVVMRDPETVAGKAQRFLMEVTRLMGVNVSVAANTDEEGNVRVDMQGDTLGILIGRRGETLDALQYLTSLNVNRGQEAYTRVTIDTESYRAKREEALTRLANRMANRAVKTGRKVVLEPMNPYERRILHSALQQNDAVTTHSEGDEPNRHVVITLK
jgi:spoIIIJ-associated protein